MAIEDIILTKTFFGAALRGGNDYDVDGTAKLIISLFTESGEYEGLSTLAQAKGQHHGLEIAQNLLALPPGENRRGLMANLAEQSGKNGISDV
ncbi:MAG: hypothetical protein KDN22_12605 [Verrucomicrobiae bacterium]|nr:hypothetical protein [Verrucomicrobiae bacterium]